MPIWKICRHISSHDLDFLWRFLVLPPAVSEVGLAICLCSFLMGDFNQTSLLVLRLLPRRLVGLTLLAVPLWGQCKAPGFLAQMFSLFPQQQKRSISSCRFRGLSSPSLSESLRSWRSQVCLCSATLGMLLWGGHWVWLAQGPFWRSCCLCQVVSSSCCVWWGPGWRAGPEGPLCTTLSPPWPPPPPPPSIWNCGQRSLPRWPRIYPTIVSVC